MTLSIEAVAGERVGDRAVSGLALSEFIADLGEGFVEVLTAPRGLGDRVRSAVIWDASNPDEIPAGAVLLAVGLGAESPEVVTFLESAAAASATAVIVKRVPNARWIRAIAQRVGVAVLTIPREMTWEQTHATVRTAIATSIEAAQPTPVPIGDLFDLANAAAASLGCSIEIDDPALNVLAFSTLDDEVDDLRRESILRRVPPPAFLEWLRSSGQLHKMRSSWEPVRLQPPGYRDRFVMAIRAGTDLLGYLWAAQVDEPLGQEQAAALAGIARIASARILRERAAEDLTRRSRRDSLRAALSGSGDSDTLCERLGLADGTEFRLLGISPQVGWVSDRVQQLLVANLVALRVEVTTPGAAVVTLGEAIYALLPMCQVGTGQLTELAQDLISRAAKQLGLELNVGIGASISSLGRLPEARIEVERIIRLIRSTPGISLASSEELRPRAVLAELREISRDRPQLLEGRIEILRQLDATRHTDYLTTLKAFFDAASDLTEAAKLLFVHRNTLRYRLRRIEELSGLNLSDPVDRLVTELQLRLSLPG